MVHASVFLTLADPTRLSILESLRGGERAVGDIVDQMSIHQSGVSRHLRILTEAGFVTMRPEGARRIYSLRPEQFEKLDAWVGAYRKVWEARLDRFAAALEKRQQQQRPSGRSTKGRRKQPTGETP
ncbi:MAG: metalloregulator ArsR/SmtB family transcription factor [Polyangiaceae bacterium]